MLTSVIALVASASGVVALAVAFIVAQTSGGGAPDIAPWISGGGAITAVGGLAYIARLMANGQLVARDVANENLTLKELVRESHRREEECADRERSYHSLLVERYESWSGRRVPREGER